MPTPLKLERLDQNGRQILEIQWDDGVTTSCRVSKIQEKCPCANCGEKRKGAGQQMMELPLLQLGELAPIRIEGMQPAGNYAYTINFSSGCNQGIYSFAELRRICGET
jgi:ATP-binding protein involved in chromosome partitioning